MDSDKVIVNRVLRGEGVLFEELVRKYLPKILGFFCKMGLSRQDAEDLSQDTLVKIYEKLYRYDDRWEFSTWLYKIASNTYKDFRKKQQPAASELDENLLTNLNSQNPIDIMLLSQDIQKLLQVLKPDVRAMLLLHYYSGLSIHEIGRIYRLSPGAVKMKLFRAREKLVQPYSNCKAVIIP